VEAGTWHRGEVVYEIKAAAYSATDDLQLGILPAYCRLTEIRVVAKDDATQLIGTLGIGALNLQKVSDITDTHVLAADVAAVPVYVGPTFDTGADEYYIAILAAGAPTADETLQVIADYRYEGGP